MQLTKYTNKQAVSCFMIFTRVCVCIQTGDIGTNDGGPKSPGSDPTPSSGDPTATGGDPTATDGDPAAIGAIQGTHPDSALPTQAPDVAPLLNKFTSFGYQITIGMVSTSLMFVYLHNSVVKSLKQQQSLPICRGAWRLVSLVAKMQLSHTSGVFYSCVS